ncbi:hypothetical protein [Streptomyces sp. NPDC008121]|uniref:hypothetical protein n=1 Tax=Streptomyces sp. NPDC008121 TaxID=3364809 RepID=UPI0036EE3D08
MPAGQAAASAPPAAALPTAPAGTLEQQADSYVYFGLVRNSSGTWDGRPVFLLTPEAERSGEGVYFMVSAGSGEVLRRSLDPTGTDPSDWRRVHFSLPRGEQAVWIKFGDPAIPGAAQTVAGVLACGG